MNEADSVFAHDKKGPGRRRRCFGAALGLILPFVTAHSAQAQTPSVGGETGMPVLTIEEALGIALSGDPGIRSAELDRRSAEAESEASARKRLPSLSASLGYTRLSELSAPDNSLPNDYSFELDLSYPIYDGGKREQSFAMAKLQASLKGIMGEEARRSLAFEVRRRYWEVSRAANAVSTFEEDLGLAQRSLELAEGRFARGSASEAEVLAARTWREKAADELDEARTELARACLQLASLMGVEPSSLPPELATKPADDAAPKWPEPLDMAALVAGALARRPEAQAAGVDIELAKRQADLSRAALRPTLAMSGSYAYADPNARMIYQTDPSQFVGTWSLGITLNFDLGGLPSALSNCEAEDLAVKRAGSEAEARKRAICLDVETCVIDLRRSERALAAAETAAGRAEDGFRIARGKLAAGTIKDLELETVQVELLKAGLEARSRLIDNLIAREDLARAVAFEGRE